MTLQALVAIGGKGTRFQGVDYERPLSKSFLEFRGRPMLYWSLLSMHQGGVTHLVLAADDDRWLLKAEELLTQFSGEFESVEYLKDPGLGVHGLPFHARALLHETYIFECGHGLTQPLHYGSLMDCKSPNTIVFSGFRPHPRNLRQPVQLHQGRVVRTGTGPRFPHAIAHPMALDLAYAEALPSLGYSIERIIQDYSARNMLRYVLSAMPPEFDFGEEFLDGSTAYGQHIDRLSG